MSPQDRMGYWKLALTVSQAPSMSLFEFDRRLATESLYCIELAIPRDCIIPGSSAVHGDQ